MRDQRVVIHGAGTAGLGIADMMRDVMVREGLSHEEATRRFWALGSRGLLVDDNPRLRDFQVPYARPAAEVTGWSRRRPRDRPRRHRREGPPDDADRHVDPGRGVHRGARPRHGRAHCERPIIMPLSNPTSKAEALPADVLGLDRGRALVATGSPFAPVELDGVTYRIAQANNALVFPGLGLGVTVARASRITDGMIAAAADAVAQLSDATRPGAPLLPPVSDLRPVSAAVAIAVARAAAAEGLAQLPVVDPIQQVHQAMWRPEYPRVETKPL